MASKLHWEDRERRPHSDWLEYTRTLLALRKSHVVPLIPRLRRGSAKYVISGSALKVEWPVENGGALILLANMQANIQANMQECVAAADTDDARLLYSTVAQPDDELQPWEVRLLQS